MKKLFLIIFAAVLLGLSAVPSWAVVVFRKGNDTPLMGLLVSQDNRRIVVRELLAGEKHRDHIILRSDIEELLFTVSQERLEKLNSDEPSAYRNYAEELAEKRLDPEARQTAIQLYLIAAYLDPQKLGRGSFLGMIDLARNPAEESKFRALAYLLDKDHDRSLLKQPPSIRTDSPSNVSSDREELLRVLKLLRQGKSVVAKRMLHHPIVVKQLAEFKTTISMNELRQASSSRGVPDSVLRRILMLELSLSNQAAEIASDSSAGKSISSWRDVLRSDGLAPIPTLSLETLTEFDPRLNVYKDGKWVASNP